MEQSIALMGRIRCIQKYLSGMRGTDLPKKIFRIFLNGFIAERMQMREVISVETALGLA